MQAWHRSMACSWGTYVTDYLNYSDHLNEITLKINKGGGLLFVSLFVCFLSGDG